MATSPAQAQNTLLTSDFGIDKVVWKYETTRNVAKATTMSDSKLYTIPHGLPFRPLCIGTYSDDNFATSYEFGNSPYFYNPVFAQNTQRIGGNVSSDATNIYIDAIKFDVTGDMQFRVVALLPPDAVNDTTVSKPSTVGGTLFSSDANYLKLYQQGTITINDDGAFGYIAYPVNHGLGYIPTALVFTEWGGKTRQLGSENYIGVSGIDANAFLTPTQLVMNVDPYYVGVLKLHYKVYLDG